MKVKILRGCAFPNPEHQKHKVGDIVEVSDDCADNLVALGLAEIIEKEKSLDEPPKNKMIKQPKKKKIMGGE